METIQSSVIGNQALLNLEKAGIGKRRWQRVEVDLRQTSRGLLAFPVRFLLGVKRTEFSLRVYLSQSVRLVCFFKKLFSVVCNLERKDLNVISRVNPVRFHVFVLSHKYDFHFTISPIPSRAHFFGSLERAPPHRPPPPNRWLYVLRGYL